MKKYQVGGIPPQPRSQDAIANDKMKQMNSFQKDSTNLNNAYSIIDAPREWTKMDNGIYKSSPRKNPAQFDAAHDTINNIFDRNTLESINKMRPIKKSGGSVKSKKK